MSFINSPNLFLLEEIVKKNFSSKYKDSVLGIFWTILKPLLIMAVFTVVFSTLFSKNIENYPVYLLSGKCIYDFFVGAVGVSMNSIRSNKGILKRTAAPKYIFILGSVFSEFLNFLISLILLVVIMFVTNASFYFSTIPLAIIPVISILIMVSGLGFMLSIFSTYYTDISHLWSVISLMFMYGSAIFYPMEIVPEPYHSYMILNPEYWAIDQFRSTVYWGVIPDYLNMLNLLLISIIILVLGIIIFKKFEYKVTMKF